MKAIMNHSLSEYLALLLSLACQQGAATPPVIAVYGLSPYLDRLSADFCIAAQQAEATLVVSFDVSSVSCQTPEDGVFALIQQLFDALIKHAAAPENRSQLLTAFYNVWNLSNTLKGLDKEERFAAFVRFTEYIAYPFLAALFRKSPNRLICVIRAMEKAENWAAIMHHFVFDLLLDALRDIDMRVIMFSASGRPPDVWYGSNEEEAANQVQFVRVDGERHAESLCGEI